MTAFPPRVDPNTFSEQLKLCLVKSMSAPPSLLRFSASPLLRSSDSTDPSGEKEKVEIDWLKEFTWHSARVQNKSGNWELYFFLICGVMLGLEIYNGVFTLHFTTYSLLLVCTRLALLNNSVLFIGLAYLYTITLMRLFQMRKINKQTYNSQKP